MFKYSTRLKLRDNNLIEPNLTNLVNTIQQIADGGDTSRTICIVGNQFLSSSPFQSPYRAGLLAAAHETFEALRGV